MRLTEAITQMQEALALHGDVEVYFDCPKCWASFAPNKVVTVAVHLTQGITGKLEKEKQP